MFTTKQAMTVVDAVACATFNKEQNKNFALSQALEWASFVVGANARHSFSEWTAEEAELIRLTGSNPDLVEALGHQTPEGYLKSLDDLRWLPDVLDPLDPDADDDGFPGTEPITGCDDWGTGEGRSHGRM
jgi:hypothetical protein